MHEQIKRAFMKLFLEWFRSHQFLGVSLVNLVKFTIFLGLGLILGRILRYPIARWLERITPESDHTTSVRVSRSIEWSVFLIIFMLVLKAGAIDVLHLPGWAWERFQQGITIVLAIASTTLFLQIVELTLYGLQQRWQNTKSPVDTNLVKFLRKGVRIFVVVLAILITADNIGVKVNGIIAGLGIGGAALALAAQGLIANILGTIEIVADKLYRPGDRIQFDQFDGFVMDIGLRSTKIRALTGEQILIPNRKMAEVQIRNFSRDGLVRTTVTIGVVYSMSDDQVRRAMQILGEIFKARSDVESSQIYLKALGAYALDLEVVFWARYATSVEYNKLKNQIHLEIKKRFDEAGIGFAFPTQTLYVAELPSSLSASSRG